MGTAAQGEGAGRAGERQWEQYRLIHERDAARGATDLGNVEEVMAGVQSPGRELDRRRADCPTLNLRVRDGGGGPDRSQVLGLETRLGAARADVEQGQLGAEQHGEGQAGADDLPAALAL